MTPLEARQRIINRTSRNQGHDLTTWGRMENQQGPYSRWMATCRKCGHCVELDYDGFIVEGQLNWRCSGEAATKPTKTNGYNGFMKKLRPR